MSIDIPTQLSGLQPQLKRLSRRFTRNDNESSDLVQDTMLKALLYQDKFTENTNLQGWLFTIMRNTFINQYRHKQRYRVMNDTTRELYFSRIADHHTFSSPERKYAWEDLWRNINCLRDDLRIPFKLHTSGYKYHEIAESLRLPIGTVKNRIFHARQELQRMLM